MAFYKIIFRKPDNSLVQLIREIVAPVVAEDWASQEATRLSVTVVSVETTEAPISREPEI